MNILESHWQDCPEFLGKIEEMVGDRQVVDVSSKANGCKESYPCSGHGGMLISLNDGTVLNVGGSSVKIGIVQNHYFPAKETHFSHYAQGYAEWAEGQMRVKK